MNIIEALYGAREERGEGIPLTDEERTQRHYKQYGTTDLPPRGTGLGQASDAVAKPFIRKDNPLLWVIIACGGYLIWRMMQAGNRKRKHAEKSIRRIEENPLLPKELPSAERRGSYGFNPCTMTPIGSAIHRPSRNPVIEGLIMSDGNFKLGIHQMWNFSLTPGPPDSIWKGSCPGASRWCRDLCYAQRGQSGMQANRAWRENLSMSTRNDFPERMISAILKIDAGMPSSHRAKSPSRKVMRVHVGGDFYSVKYVNDWIQIANALRKHGWFFYTYTRCWRPQAEKYAPGIRNAIQDLRKLPNVSIMASTDPDTGPPPPGWREAGVDRCFTKSIVCPNIAQEMKVGASNVTIFCYNCLKCADRTGPGVLLPAHSFSKKDMELHQSFIEIAKKKWPMVWG